MNSISCFTILTALIFGLAVRVLAILRFADFSGDQIRDAYVSMEMWQGILPTLGPSSAWGDIYLPPLYFYLTFPFTAFGADLAWQAIANGILTFLSIPLLIFTTYQLLENTPHPKRLMISSVAGLWYSLLFQNIIINTGNSLAGNSGSVPFFLLAFVLLYKYQWEGKITMRLQAVCWLLYGLTLGLIGSLHFAPLFVMSAAFVVSVIAFIAKYPKKLALPGLSIFSGLLIMLPYWIGEFGRDWSNTQGIINLVFKASNDDGYSVTFFQRLQSVVRGYLSLGPDVYFSNESLKVALVSGGFLVAILFIALLKFKGNKPIFSLLLCIWLIFLYAYSSTNMENTYDPVFYKLLIFCAPIILTSVCFAYLDKSKLLEKGVIFLLIAIISISAAINLSLHKNYFYGRYGAQRVANTSDYRQALRELPDNVTICDINGHRPSNRVYEYSNQYIVKKPLDFRVNCQGDDYVIYPKFRSLGNFKTTPSKDFSSFEKPHELFHENDVFYIFHMGVE